MSTTTPDFSTAIKNATFLLRLNGVVQGVGFRPFVYQLAKERGLTGQVSNDANGVAITLNATQPQAQQFLDTIVQTPPPLATITHYTIEKAKNQPFANFNIVESTRHSQSNSLLLTADFALCESCRAELYAPQNRRYRYPFITCTQCGPRYSIQQRLPYERHNTTMHAFTMCLTCQSEYNDPTQPRFYSQTNSCPTCGIRLGWYKSEKNEARKIARLEDTHWILTRVNGALKAGKIVAVKGIGGYLLLCDATNNDAVLTLRQRKNRPSKPLALLYPNLDALQKDTLINEREIQALQSTVAPIVLVKQRKTGENRLAVSINPQLTHLGVILPYSPLLDLIANDFGKPLVATSGNVSGSPIVFKDEQALTELVQVADYILTNNREIAIPQDDSVVRFTPQHHQKIIIRRSRGFFNGQQHKACSPTEPAILAMGASLKSTFALQTAHHLHVSQYLGDLADFETQENFRHTLDHFLGLFSTKPDRLLADAHEDYFSTRLATELGTDWHIPVVKIQHHAAHFAAVLAENELLTTSEEVLGFVWDGTGYGSDKQIRGGEVFRFVPSSAGKISLTGIGHFDYFDAFLGDKMPLEPRLSAFSLLYSMPEYEHLVRNRFTEQEWLLYNKLLAKNTLKTDSVGRIFDGVASLLGLLDKNSYEGEAALRLEESAEHFFSQHGYQMNEHYFQNSDFETILPTQLLMQGIAQDIIAQKPRDFIAAKFHFSLAKSVETISNKLHINKIAFSGGVFQNAVLVDLLLELMGKTHELFFHRTLAPNDECIAFGQLAFETATSNNL